MNRLKNVLLSLSTLLLLYIALEAFALTIFYALLPPLVYSVLDDGLPVILQKTKQTITPKHYLALIGDSYAMGLGDQYYHMAGDAQAAYGSAPFIHNNIKKDVISFGSAGNGSIAGMVTEPLSTLAYWKSSSRLSIDDPQILLMYFYEGNDLNDNVEYLQKASKKRLTFDYTQLHNSSYFQNYIQEIALNQDALYQRAQHLHWYNELYLGKCVLRLSAALLAQIPIFFGSHNNSDNKSDANRSPLNHPGRFAWTAPGTINRARIGGKEMQLPDNLQGPSMDLSSDEKDIALISLRESLRFLKSHLPNTKIILVYLPSPISCYDTSSSQVSLQSHARRKQFVFDTAAVKQQSDWIEKQVLQISAEEKIAFIDARPALQQAAATQLLHGPLDWNHFNELGYRVLAKTITSSPLLAPP